MADNYTATLTLYGVFAGEEETKITGISLEDTGNGYEFSGSATSARKTTFTYKGKVNKESLSLDLAEIKIADNIFTKQNKYSIVPTLGEVESGKMSYSAIFNATSADKELGTYLSLISGIATPIFIRGCYRCSFTGCIFYGRW
ncbi:MAG: DUF4925 domain-containing protein [Bacteroides sp.]|nr:DUF4925 domain-containing protein [Bacteroides sp.]